MTSSRFLPSRISAAALHRVMLVVFLIGTGCHTWAQAVQAYTVYPRYQQEAPPFRVSVQGVSVPVAVFEPPTSHRAEYYYAHFSFSGTVAITVSADQAMTLPTISPLSFHITPSLSGDKKSFTFNLTTSRYLILSIAGHPPLVIAADPSEEKPDMTGAHIITDFGAGTDKDAGTNTTAIQRAIDTLGPKGGLVYVPAGLFVINQLILRDNVILYLDGNAVLRAADDVKGMSRDFSKSGVYTLDASDLSGKRVLPTDGGTFLVSTDPKGTKNAGIHGRGMLDGNGYYLRRHALWLTSLVVARNAVNFSMDGVTGWDGGFWAVIAALSKGPMRITNYKGLQSLGYFDPGLGSKGYSDMSQNDGIDVCNSSRVSVVHALVISKDDSYSTKSLHNGSPLSKHWIEPTTDADTPPMKDILFKDVVGWSTTRVFKIGEGNNFGQEGITFDHGYVYRSRNAISVDTSSGTAATNNIVFSNIDVELTTANQNGKRNDDTWFEVQPKEGPVNNVTLFNANIRGVDSSRVPRFTLLKEAPITNVAIANVAVMGTFYKGSPNLPDFVMVRGGGPPDRQTSRQATQYDSATGVTCASGCKVVGPLTNKATLTYSVDFGVAPVSTMYLRLSSQYSGALEIHDGDASSRIVGVMPVPITDKWTSFQVVPVPIRPLTGKHTITLVAVRDDETPFLDLDSFSF